MKPKPLNLRFDDITIPNNEIAEASFDMIVRALRRNEREVDTKEEAYDIVFSLLEEYKDTLLKEVKQRIKSACEFYLKCKDNPRLFVYENPKYIEEINELLGENWKSIKSRKMNTLHNEIFNNWLFKLAFGDVFDGDIEEVV